MIILERFDELAAFAQSLAEGLPRATDASLKVLLNRTAEELTRRGYLVTLGVSGRPEEAS